MAVFHAAASVFLAVPSIGLLFSLLNTTRTIDEAIRVIVIAFVGAGLSFVFSAHSVMLWRLRRRAWVLSFVLHSFGSFSAVISIIQGNLNASSIVLSLFNLAVVSYLLVPNVRKSFS